MRRASILVGQLLDIPDSRFRADTAGGRQYLGWDSTRYLAAQTHDVLLSILMGLGGQKVAQSDFWPRPQVEAVAPIEAQTIADFDTGRFFAWLMS
jgi:hypothetical protein